MRKIYSIAILALAVAGLVSTSCSKDYLNTNPTSQVDEGTIFTNTESALMAINGVHRQMHCFRDENNTTRYYSQGGYPTFCLHLAMMSDDVIFTFSNTAFPDTQSWVHLRDLTHKYQDCNYYWMFFYAIINNVNKVIAVIDDIPTISTDESCRNFVKGQAYAYRAFAYFQLVQVYAKRYVPGADNQQDGVILRLTPSTQAAKRASVEDVYSRINADLDTAINCLTGNSYKKDKGLNKSHIDEWVAKTIKARVLLTQGRYKEAADVAYDVYKNSGATLDPTTYTDSDKQNRMSNMNNKEWIWGLSAIGATKDQFPTLCNWHDFISNNAASYNANSPRAINCLLYNTIPATDVRKAMWLPDPWAEGVTVKVNASGRIVPWISQKWLVDDSTSKYAERDVPYIRLPEVMTMVAEGYARSKQELDKAREALSELGKSRDPQYKNVSGFSAEQIVEETMWQRRVELWAEVGLRWFDLKRLDLPCDRGPAPRDGFNQGGTENGWSTSMKKVPENIDPLASNFNMYGTKPIQASSRVIPRPSEDDKWQWLIPTQELNANPLCTQND